MPKKRGAVVIGVRKTGDLPVLESPADGADKFAAWLASQGFEAKPITDATGPVTPQRVVEAIEAFVNSGTYHQLVVYFSGHGYWKNESELWLLTDAPNDANAAISWVETVEFAKDCGIPNVVVISDACRSIPKTPRAMKVRGSIVFPNQDGAGVRAKVDKFMAAATGTAAYEIPVAGFARKQSLFTRCFLRAFEKPDQEMIRDVEEDGVAIKVVPNRRLENYLRREVAAELAQINIALNQTPDAEVLSDDDVYIGRASHLPGPTILPPPPQTFHVADVAMAAVGRALSEQPEPSGIDAEAIRQVADATGFDRAVHQARAIPDVRHFETETGFTVMGTAVADVLAIPPGHAAIVVPGGQGAPGIVRVEPHGPPYCSVLLRFANGGGTALAALRGFIAHVVLDQDRIVSVNYIPSDNSFRWDDYGRRRIQLDELRATVAASARLGVFRLGEKKRAQAIARDVRMGKGLDPALGIYAAYAYSEADRRDAVESVLHHMRNDLNVDLFDVALLARTLTTGRPPNVPVVPFCPMLTQGWNLLRARRVKLPLVLEDAQDELEPALWTTFKPSRSRMIFDAIRKGEIT